jgi:hypothetical protein
MRYAVIALAAALSLAVFGDGGENTFAQALPNPYRIVDGWAQLPNGRAMGAVGKAAIDRDGRHLWAVIRCESSRASAAACSSGRTGSRSTRTEASG